MYVGKNFSASRTELLSATFTCESCEHSADADVLGVGQGGAASPYMLDDGGAQQRAARQAQQNAWKDAELVVSLAKCPACGRRNPAAVRAFRLKAALNIVGVLAASCAVGALLRIVVSARSRDEVMGTAAGIAVALFGALVGLTLESGRRSSAWAGSVNRVVFATPPPERRSRKRRATPPPET